MFFLFLLISSLPCDQTAAALGKSNTPSAIKRYRDPIYQQLRQEGWPDLRFSGVDIRNLLRDLKINADNPVYSSEFWSGLKVLVEGMGSDQVAEATRTRMPHAIHRLKRLQVHQVGYSLGMLQRGIQNGWASLTIPDLLHSIKPLRDALRSNNPDNIQANANVFRVADILMQERNHILALHQPYRIGDLSFEIDVLIRDKANRMVVVEVKRTLRYHKGNEIQFNRYWEMVNVSSPFEFAIDQILMVGTRAVTEADLAGISNRYPGFQFRLFPTLSEYDPLSHYPEQEALLSHRQSVARTSLPQGLTPPKAASDFHQ